MMAASAFSVTNNDDSVKLQVDVSPDTSGTEIPSYTCTATFAFVDNVNDANLELAVNSVSWTCLSEHITLAYCPTMATITPSSGDFNAGDVLTCSADGSPEPSYSWTDSGGAEVSTTNTMTLSGGAFELTCTATGSASTTSCSVSSTTTSGFALGCPGNMAASASGQVLVNSDITCTSTGGAPDPTYQWLNIDGSVLSSTATVTITATGDFNYTCVATSTHTDGRECVAMYSVTGTGVTELSPTQAAPTVPDVETGSGAGTAKTTLSSTVMTTEENVMTESNSPEVLYIALALIGLLVICVFVIVVVALVVAKHRRKAARRSQQAVLESDSNPASRRLPCNDASVTASRSNRDLSNDYDTINSGSSGRQYEVIDEPIRPEPAVYEPYLIPVEYRRAGPPAPTRRDHPYEMIDTNNTDNSHTYTGLSEL